MMAMASGALGLAGRAPFQAITKPAGPLCNLRCEYCFYLDKAHLYAPGERFRMTPALLESYVRQYIEAQPGPEVAFLWQGGEPTLMGVDYFRAAVALQRRHLPEGWRCTNSLQTNGTLLDAEWCEFLREHDFLVGISIDGPAPLHDRFRTDRTGGPTHAAVLRGLHLLQQHGVEHNALCVVNRVNAEHPLDVYRFLRDEGLEWVQFIPLVERDGERGVSERTVGPVALGSFLGSIFDEWVRHDFGRVFVQLFEECLRAWVGLPAALCVFAETCGRGLAVEHNGDVFSCDHFVDPDHRLGSITETPLRRLADSAQQTRFGRDKADRLPELCRGCDVRFVCNGGCPKDRFTRTADGEDGLNFLCEGYRAFFHHVDSPMRRMADLCRRGIPPAAISAELLAEDAARVRAVGRNGRCPCGSGRKAKHCCLAGAHVARVPTAPTLERMADGGEASPSAIVVEVSDE